MSKVNLKTLAKELAVSISTVSKALRDSHEIGDETKQKVLAKAKELGLWLPVDLPEDLLSLKSLNDYKQKGGDPMLYLKRIVDLHSTNQQVRESLRRSLAGYSLWTQVAWLVCLLRQH